MGAEKVKVSLYVYKYLVIPEVGRRQTACFHPFYVHTPSQNAVQVPRGLRHIVMVWGFGGGRAVVLVGTEEEARTPFKYLSVGSTGTRRSDGARGAQNSVKGRPFRTAERGWGGGEEADASRNENQRVPNKLNDLAEVVEPPFTNLASCSSTVVDNISDTNKSMIQVDALGMISGVNLRALIPKNLLDEPDPGAKFRKEAIECQSRWWYNPLA
jgi:hypothetical protein